MTTNLDMKVQIAKVYYGLSDTKWYDQSILLVYFNSRMPFPILKNDTLSFRQGQLRQIRFPLARSEKQLPWPGFRYVHGPGGTPLSN